MGELHPFTSNEPTSQPPQLPPSESEYDTADLLDAMADVKDMLSLMQLTFCQDKPFLELNASAQRGLWELLEAMRNKLLLTKN